MKLGEGQPIRALALVPYPLNTSPSQRFRLEQWRPHLATAGVQMELSPFLDHRLMRRLYAPGKSLSKAAGMALALARRLRTLRTLRDVDLVVVHRAATLAGPAWVERVVSSRGFPLVYDFDDAIYLLHTSAVNRRTGWLKFPGKTASICRMADRVVVANAVLAGFARLHNSRVDTVPSSVDTDVFVPVRRTRRDRLVLGWTGSSTSMTHLERFADVLREILGRRDMELRVHSDRQPDLRGIRFEWRPWTAESEPRELAEFDIGIMPMPDDAWARGKSAMKALLCMAVGVPVVCSAVGTNRDVIDHGVNGLLAQRDADWPELIERLADDAALRQRLGSAGRVTVETRYSARNAAELFGRVLGETLSERKRP